MTNWYLSTSIPYVNGQPHIGFLLEALIADAYARYHRLKGDDVFFLSGTDDNSLSNVRAAEAAGRETRDLVEENAAEFERLVDCYSLTYDDFIRTSRDPRHLEGVAEIWRACQRAGDIYLEHYSGHYCVGCERFYEVDELSGNRCPEHDIELEKTDETNYFFRLSRYEDKLRELIENDVIQIRPEVRRNEALSLVWSGLRDVSISRSIQRSRGWGIPVPGDPSQVVYVWFDALTNYVNALDGDRFEKYWASDGARTHIIGKDILRFHALLWPAILLSAGIALPKTILVHGFITLDGRSLSKKRGVLIDPFDLADRFGTDAVRYYLLKRASGGSDHDFRHESIESTYTSQLANQLGNLASRTLTLIDRDWGGIIPAPTHSPPEATHLIELVESLPSALDRSLVEWSLGSAIDAINEVISETNRFLVLTEPWKTTGTERDSALRTAAEALLWIGILIGPFLPESSDRLKAAFETSLSIPDLTGWGLLEPGDHITKIPPLFPRKNSLETEIAPAS